MGAALWLAGLVACMPGPVEETVVPDLRVMAVVPSTPEASPGESIAVGVEVMDPSGEGAEVLRWACAPGFGCTAPSPDPEVVVPQVPATDAPAPLVFLYGYACAPGLCAEPDVEDPIGWMATQPLIGASLGTKRLAVSTRAPEARATHPVLTGPEQVADGDEVPLGFTVVAPAGVEVELWNYATLGGWGEISVPVVDGSAETIWYAAEGAGELLVVATDPAGGVATWRAAVSR